MKKKLIVLFLLVNATIFSMDAYLKLGAITKSSSYNNENNSFQNYAPTFGMEITQDLLLADVGVGIAYNGKISETNLGTVPAYGLIKIDLFPIMVKPYLVGKLGKVLHTYNKIDDSNLDGKYYYGAGVGMDIFSLQGEILYSITRVKGDNRGNSNLGQISLTLGYKFY